MGEKFLEYKILNSIGESDIFSIFLMGMSGVGKTEVARTLHSLLGGKKQLAKINFGNYSSQESLNSLIGSPRGYIGSETGELFEKIYNSDTGIILIDEFEKADGKVFNYFLEVLETGYATNSQGDSLNLNGYIFVFTSNVPEEKFEQVFSPELRSRFNLVSLFNPLNVKDKEIYIYTRLKKYVDEFNSIHDKNLNKKSIDKIVKSINVHNYQNLRLLNNQIRKEFIKHIKGAYPPNDKLWQK
jgi:ATP-dependent Clp protease ATP-binding subunit ClpC